MSKSIFLFDNQVDEATLLASTEASAVLAVENLQNEQRTKRWRSGAGTSSTISITLSESLGVDYFALIDLNLTTGGEIRLQSWDDALDGAEETLDETISPTLYVSTDVAAAAFGQGLFGSGAFGANAALSQSSGRNITIYALPETSYSQYFKITLTDTNTTYQQMGRLFLGKALEFDYNLSVGCNIRRVPLTTSKFSIGRQRFKQPRGSQLQISGTFPHLTDAERVNILIRLEDYINYKPFVYSIYPDNDNNGLSTTLYGVFDGSPDVTPEFFNSSRLNFTVTEEL